jgi:arabinogalactan oligomer/maltooligosaccharide transport system substrate-binding protein
MKTKIIGSAIALFLSASLVGCQAETTESGLPQDFDFSEIEPETEEVEIVTIWAPAAVADSIKGITGAFENEYGVTIQISKVELAEMRSRLLGENQPDVFFGSHVWTAELVEAGLVAPIEIGILGQSVPESLIEAFGYGDDYFAIPVSEQHVALLCNAEMVEEQPSLSDLESVGLGVGLDPELGDPYHLQSVMSSFGLDLKNPEQTDFSNDLGYEFANWMTENGSELFDLESDYATVLSQFNSGEIGCWLTGPWASESVKEDLRDSLAVYPFPQIGDYQPSPLVDAAGFFVSANSDDPVYANRLVIEYLTRPGSQLAVARSLTGVPAVETNDEFLNQFSATVTNATPTPVTPLMERLWPLLGATQAELIKNERGSVEIWTEFLGELEVIRGN